MPTNRFPDSKEKREVRRRVARDLTAFRDREGVQLGLAYCGMPSVEFLDVIAWQDSLRSVCAIEIDQDVLSDMRIQWDSIGLRSPIHFVNANVLEFLCSTSDCYDVYNLDFYGGLIYRNARGNSRCVEAIRQLIHRQSVRQLSFALVTTFNVRDQGVKEYVAFIDDVPRALPGWPNIESCCAAHKRNQATRLKLCFPYFCWHVGSANHFAVRFSEPIVYTSSATMIHFYAEFIYQQRALPDITSNAVLADLVSMPLIRLKGLIPTTDLMPPQVQRPA